MTINFVGNYQQGYVGEDADEVHLARELEKQHNTVRRIPRDAWREYVKEGFPKDTYDVPEDIEADVTIIAKWNHFYDESFIKALRERSGGPVLYWVWDYMWDQGFPDWHIKAAREADLYLSNEGGLFDKYRSEGVTPHYFPMDVCDGDIPVFKDLEKKYDVIFTGSYLGQGDRIEYLKEITKEIPVKIFSWNHEDWKKAGFDAEPARYGEDFNRLVAESKIVLGFSVNAHCWGYWSNRVGKVIRAGGLLLYQYAPGMEILPMGTFTTPKEAVYMAKGALTNPSPDIGYFKELFTSEHRCLQLDVLINHYLQEGKIWNKLP